MREKAHLISFLYPAQNKGLIEELAKKKATVFAICADGLGTRDEIMDWPLPEFYNSMYYRLSKSVEAMRRNGIDDSKINKETGISLDTLEKI